MKRSQARNWQGVRRQMHYRWKTGRSGKTLYSRIDLDLHRDRKLRRLDDILRWAELCSNQKYKRVAQRRTHEHWISTIWLGLNSSFMPGEPGLFFETMVFCKHPERECKLDHEQLRYENEKQARKVHNRLVHAVYRFERRTGGDSESQDEEGAPVGAPAEEPPG